MTELGDELIGEIVDGGDPTNARAEPDSFGAVGQRMVEAALGAMDAPGGDVGDLANQSTDQLEVASGEAGLWSDAFATLRRSPTFVAGLFGFIIMVLMAAAPSLFTFFYPSRDDTACELGRSANVAGQGRPSGQHWFGFDIQGCDYYLKTIEGARTSIAIGLLVTAIAILVALTFGTIAGYVGGFADSVIARIADVWFAIPTILFATIFLSVVTGLPSWLPFVDDTRSIAEVAIVMGLTGWPSMLRLMRASVMANREADYVLASRALGSSSWRIITRHIIPNSLAPVIVYATIFIGVVISAEAALSFLGIGVQLPAVSWGLMISAASTRFDTNGYLLLFPGTFLFITILSFVMMGDALRDALDPKLR